MVIRLSETMMVIPILARIGRGADLSRQRREHKEDGHGGGAWSGQATDLRD